MPWYNISVQLPKMQKNKVASGKNDLQSVEECGLSGAVEAEDEDAHLLRAEEVAEVAHEPAHPGADPLPSSQMSNGPSNLFGLMMWAMLTSKPGRQVAEWWAGERRANHSTRKVQRVNTNAMPNSMDDIFHHVDHSYGHDSGTVSEDGACYACRDDEGVTH